MSKKKIIEDLEQQIAFEKQREIGKNTDFTTLYKEGYIDGLRQAIACIKKDH